MNLKERRNQFRVVAIALMSMIALLFFQNCGGAISNSQSMSSSTAAGGSNTSSGTKSPAPAPTPTSGTSPSTTPAAMPPPSPLPAPAPPSPGTQPVTQALRQSLCNPFVDVTKKVSYLASPAIPASVTITSGAGNGGTNIGNGDTTDGTVRIPFKYDSTIINVAGSQALTPPPQYVQTPKIACAFDVKTTIEVVKGTIGGVNYDPAFTKAIDVKTGSATYGANIATSDATAAQALASRVVKFTMAATTPVTTNDALIGINLLRDDNGLRCVNGYFYIRFATTTQVENSNITQSFTASDANYRYVKVIVQDGCWAESRLAAPTAPVRTAGYGTAVASSPNWMAVLSTKDDGLVGGVPVTGTGTVSMFQKNGNSWSFCQEITVPNAVATTEPLTSVALSSSGLNMAIGSASTKDINGLKAGAVHIYNYNSGGSCAAGTAWSWRQKLASDTEARIGQGTSNKNQLFGTSVAISDSRLAVGAPIANNNSGAVYIFNCSGGQCGYSEQIANTDGTNAAFGSSLALSGNVLAVGAPQAYGTEADGNGFVAVYDITGSYSQLSKVRPTDLADETRTSMRFGDSVSVMGNRLLVGAPYRSNEAGGVTYAAAGAAYFFQFVGQSTPSSAASTIQKRRIQAGNTANLFVGRAVALSTDGMYVSQDGINTREGNVSFFTDTRVLAGTTLAVNSNDYTLFGLDKSASNDFGYAISVSGNYVLIGARVKPSPNTAGGAAYVYLKP